jgi:putative LysE/RhtB family amino acid efflux pump
MFAATFMLTLANPTTILSFAALFAGLGLFGTMSGGAAAGVLTAGVFLGSMLWWIFLSGAVSLLRARVPRTALFWVNRVSGALLVAFGGYVLAIALVTR